MAFLPGCQASLLFLIGTTTVNLAAAVAPVSVVHGKLRLEVEEVEGLLQESFSVRNGAGWKSIATSDGKTQGALSICSAGSATLGGAVENISLQGDRVVEEIAGDGWGAKRTIDASGDSNWVHISTVLAPTRALTLHSYADTFRAGLQPDWAFSPSVGGFNPDGQYKSPLILVQEGSNALAVVPDLLALNRSSLKRSQHSLELDASGKPQLSVGYIPAKQAYHTVFKEDLDRTWTVSDPITNSYYVYVAGNAPAREAYREAVRFEWNQFGRTELSRAAETQSGTDPKYSTCHLWDEWRQA